MSRYRAARFERLENRLLLTAAGLDTGSNASLLSTLGFSERSTSPPGNNNEAITSDMQFSKCRQWRLIPTTKGMS